MKQRDVRAAATLQQRFIIISHSDITSSNGVAEPCEHIVQLLSANQNKHTAAVTASIALNDLGAVCRQLLLPAFDL